jgi:thioredoxin 2
VSRLEGMAATEIACSGCGARNRIPVATSGKPRCAKCHLDLPWLAEATSADFDQVIKQSSLPVLVDLWAPWCGPCRMVAPALATLSTERAGSLRVVKVNVDEAPEVSARLGVQGIPTMVLYAGGAEVGRQVGALPLERIRAWVDGALQRS